MPLDAADAPAGRPSGEAAAAPQSEAFLKRVARLMQEPKVVEVFAQFDLDGTGTCDRGEVAQILASVGQHQGHTLSETDVSSMMRRLDVNNDGEVDLWEMCSYLIARHDEIAEERSDVWSVDRAFDLFRTEARPHGGGGEAVAGGSDVVSVGEILSQTRRAAHHSNQFASLRFLEPGAALYLTNVTATNDAPADRHTKNRLIAVYLKRFFQMLPKKPSSRREFCRAVEPGSSATFRGLPACV